MIKNERTTPMTHQNQNMERIIIMSNDSDVIGMAICYRSTLLNNVPELGVQSSAETFLPIHEIVWNRGPQLCCVLPFVTPLGAGIPSVFLVTLG